MRVQRTAIGVGLGVLAALLPRPAAAERLRIAVPVVARVTSERPFAWRAADGARGEERELHVRGLRPPVRLRGEGIVATSGGVAFPLPAELIRYEEQWYAVVRLERERYLVDVVATEMSPNWPTEALAAQAVVARTFAEQRRRRARSRGLPFDLVAGTRDQAFTWRRVPPKSVERAVAATSGYVLRTRSGDLAEVFYHSCCGGVTADPREVWGRAVPGIVSVPDRACTICPKYFWHRRFTPGELGGLLGMGPIRTVEVLERGGSGRIVRIRLVDDRGELELTGMAFRRRLGAERLPSTLVKIEPAETEAGPVWLFSGSGSGHGAGLCQWGARGMAEEGRSWREILRHFFPRLELGRL